MQESTNRVWRLERRPVDTDFASALTLKSEPLGAPAAGEVLIRNQYLSMDAGTRMWMTDREDGYNPPVPLGAIMPGMVLGRVVASAHADYQENDLVRGFGQWAEYSLVEPELAALVKLDDTVSDLKDYFGVLGVNAWTALWGLAETGDLKPGETVVVSAAAGATGVLACQIAKLLGGHVVGIAGGERKCAWLRDEIGVDAAIDYKSGDVQGALAALGREVDVFFDNVGGPILDAVMANMALHGRIAICGLLDQYKGDGRAPGPSHFDQVLMKRLRVEGFFIPDFFDQGDRLTERLKPWVASGELSTPFDVNQGIEGTLDAYSKLFTGENIGKVLVEL